MTAATSYPEDRPQIVGRYRHWVRLQWPDGRIEVTSARKAERLGAVEQKNSNQPRRTP